MSTRPYFDKYIDIYGAVRPGFKDSSNPYRRMAQQALKTAYGGKIQNAPYEFQQLYTQATKFYGGKYDLAEYERLIAPHTYDIWYNSGGKTQVDQWHQSDIKAQQDAIAKQKAEQERLRAEQEAKAREQQAALERQRQAAEKARKEAEFKSALDAMNQRANVKRTDEVVGEMSETPEQAAQRKKKRVGYDATKVTGILGAAPTESKKLLGM